MQKIQLKKEPNTTLLYGIHAVISALENSNRKIIRIFCTRNNFEKFQSLIEKFPYKICDREAIDDLIRSDHPSSLDAKDNIVHQGIAAITKPMTINSLKDIDLEKEPNRILILDQIADPHNVGAIIRSAAAFNFSTVITTNKHAPKEDSIIAKTASGAMEKINFVTVSNIANVIDSLKKCNFWVIGLDSNAQKNFEHQYVSPKFALVLGSEHKGLRPLTAKKCDVLLKLFTSNLVESLNVSNAAAIAMYETSKV